MSADKVSSKTHVLHFPPEKTVVHPRRRKMSCTFKLEIVCSLHCIFLRGEEPCVRNCCRKGGKGHNHSSCFDIMSRAKMWMEATEFVNKYNYIEIHHLNTDLYEC